MLSTATRAPTRTSRRAADEPASSPSAGPELDLRHPTRRAAVATLIACIPFALAVLVGIGSRLWMTDRAADAVARLAVQIEAQRAQGATESAIVEAFGQAPGQGDQPHAVGTRPRLVRSLYHQLSRDEFDKEPTTKDISKRVFADLLCANVPGVVSAHAFLVLFFPALFGVMFFHAARGIREWPTLLAQPGGPTFDDHVWHWRHRRWLTDEARPMFWRRLSFGLLLSLGTTYVLAPAGVQASVVGEYVALQFSVGETSHPFSLEYFRHAPPYVVGFAGYYLYAITTCLGRFSAGTLNQRLVLSLVNRGITVIILGLVLSAVTVGDEASRALVFLAGVFPETGLRFLGKLAQTAVEQTNPDPARGFRALPEIDLWKEAALAERGITSIHDLAVSDWKHVLEAVGGNPRVMLRAADRALLMHTFGIEGARRLEGLPIFTASELVLYALGTEAYAGRWKAAAASPRHAIGTVLDRTPADERIARLNGALETQDVSLQIEQLAMDRNVIFVVDNKVGHGNL